MSVCDISTVREVLPTRGLRLDDYRSACDGYHAAKYFELVESAVQCAAKIPPMNKETDMKDEVQEAREHLARAEAALAAKIAKETFTAEVNRKIRIAAAIVQALSDMRGLENNEHVATLIREEYAEFKSELCATLKEYGYKIVYVGDKSKATVVKC